MRVPGGAFVTQHSKLRNLYTKTKVRQHCIKKSGQNVYSVKKKEEIYSGTLLTRSSMGQKRLGCFFFFTRKCMAVLPGGQKSGRNNEVAVRRGFTVHTQINILIKKSFGRRTPCEVNRYVHT